MENFISKLRKDFPNISFEAGNSFCWSPKQQKIEYDSTKMSSDKAVTWAILHELGHALLGHNTYNSDFELLQLEAQAWQKAQELEDTYLEKIDQDHIQNCLDTYRDWLHRRSTCPVCTNVSLQQDKSHYKCFNCHTVWSVTTSRFCRPYRQLKSANKKSPVSQQATFA